jgi:spoIIIJ-associated protein
MTNPWNDTDQAATKITDYLTTLIAGSGLKLEFAIQLHDGQSAPSAGRSVAARITVEFTGHDTPLLLARNGELLHAIEHVAAKILRLEPEDHDCISFDTEGFKSGRDRELLLSAERAIEQVRTTGRPYSFPSMTSRERRMLHLILSTSGLSTASSGEGPRRFVVLYPPGSTESDANSSTRNGRPAPEDAAARTQAIRNRFRRR